MKETRFTATLLEGHKGGAFEVPFDPNEKWSIPDMPLRKGRRGHRVQGTINGAAFESAIVPRSKRFFLEVDAELQKRLDLSTGDDAKIVIRPVAPTVRERTKSSGDALERVRALCLALPDTEEKIAWGASTFRVKGRIFVMFSDDHHGDGRVAAWCAAPEGVQRDVVAADPKRFFVPPYVGPNGWIGIIVDGRPKWSEVAAFIEQAHAFIAAKASAKKTRRR
jgi:hypothetical protein